MQQEQNPSQEMEQLLKSRFALHLRYRNAFRQIIQALKLANIPVVNMRGLSLAPYYHEQIAYRPQSDIDLLFQPQDLLMAKQVLGSIGFYPDTAYPNVFARGGVQLDLHTEPLGIERMKSWHFITPLRASDFFSHAIEGQLADEQALIVKPQVMLPYLCFHALKHSFERLIWLYDIALMAKHIEQNQLWASLLESIQKYTLERPCFYALSYVQEHMGAPVPNDLLNTIKPKMGFIERRLFKRFMKHENIPFLAERLFAQMQPSLKHRLEFWRETIYPSYEVRAQIGGGSCVKCSFIRKRFKQLGSAIWSFTKEIFLIARA